MDACTATGSLEMHSGLAVETSKAITELWLFCLAADELLYAVLVS